MFSRAGLTGRLGTHCLRKSFGSILADQGTGLHVIQELLGHSSIATTRAYLGVGVKNMRGPSGACPGPTERPMRGARGCGMLGTLISAFLTALGWFAAYGS